MADTFSHISGTFWLSENVFRMDVMVRNVFRESVIPMGNRLCYQQSTAHTIPLWNTEIQNVIKWYMKQAKGPLRARFYWKLRTRGSMLNILKRRLRHNFRRSSTQLKPCQNILVRNFEQPLHTCGGVRQGKAHVPSVGLCLSPPYANLRSHINDNVAQQLQNWS